MSKITKTVANMLADNYPAMDPEKMETTSTEPEKPKRKSRAKKKKSNGHIMTDGTRYVNTNGTWTRIDDKASESGQFHHPNNGKRRRAVKEHAKRNIRAAIRERMGL